MSTCAFRSAENDRAWLRDAVNGLRVVARSGPAARSAPDVSTQKAVAPVTKVFPMTSQSHAERCSRAAVCLHRLQRLGVLASGGKRFLFGGQRFTRQHVETNSATFDCNACTRFLLASLPQTCVLSLSTTLPREDDSDVLRQDLDGLRNAARPEFALLPAAAPSTARPAVRGPTQGANKRRCERPQVPATGLGDDAACRTAAAAATSGAASRTRRGWPKRWTRRSEFFLRHSRPLAATLEKHFHPLAGVQGFSV